MPDSSHRRLLYAHRGAAAEFPENTLPSFRRALEIGVDVLETDLHMTVDGHVIVSHDPTAMRMAGVAARYASSTLAEVKSWDAGHGYVDADGHRPHAGKGIRIPTLEELLLEFPGVALNVDIKQATPPMVCSVLALLRRTRSVDRVTVASFSTRIILEVRRRGYEGRTALSFAEIASFLALSPRRWRAVWRRMGGLADSAQLPCRQNGISLDTSVRIQALHALGMRVDYWTINDPGKAKQLLERGADGIMTDDPARIRPVFDALTKDSS